MHTNHTPGPWTIADDGTIETQFAGRVGHLSGVWINDARLIAAAPDLLAALQEMLIYAEGHVEEAHILYARAAIARATGEA